MQWEKLERTYAALEAVLRSLQPSDHFNVLLFNQNVQPFQPQPATADPATVQKALDFVRSSKLRGGTDLAKALAAGLAQTASLSPSQADRTSLVLLTDGGSDRGETVLPNKIAAQYAARWKALAHPPHTAVLAVGDDANITLLRNLAHNGSFVEPVLSTEPLEFHLQSFLSKLKSNPVAGLTLDASPTASIKMIYPLDDAVYPGSLAEWVGEYSPGKPLTLTAHGVREVPR